MEVCSCFIRERQRQSKSTIFLKFARILKFVKIREFYEFLKFIKFDFSIYEERKSGENVCLLYSVGPYRNCPTHSPRWRHLHVLYRCSYSMRLSPNCSDLS